MTTDTRSAPFRLVDGDSPTGRAEPRSQRRHPRHGWSPGRRDEGPRKSSCRVGRRAPSRSSAVEVGRQRRLEVELAPVTGCAKRSRARAGTGARARDRPSRRTSGSPETGRSIAARWTRIWCVRPVSRRTSSSACSGRSSTTSNRVTASRGSSVSSDRRVGSRRSRPIGASIRPVASADARARARDSGARPHARRIASWSAPYACSERATTSRPDVSRSSRWTIPGRSGSSPPAAPSVRSCAGERPADAPAPGCIAMPAGLSTTSEVLVLVRDRHGDGLGVGALRARSGQIAPRRPRPARAGGSSAERRRRP